MATAETVVVEVLARMDGFDGKVRQSANAFGGGMKTIENSATRAEATVGRSMRTVERSFDAAAQRSRNLGYQISDIGSQLSTGTSPFVILAQQGPQVANALDGAKGAVGKFATFLSGPLGAAVLFATTMLGGFLLKSKETGDTVDDLVEKLKKKAEQDAQSARATDIFSMSLEGLEAAAVDAKKAVNELKNAQKTQAEQTVESIQRTIAGAEAIRHETRMLLDAAEAQNEKNKGSLANADPRFASQFNVSQDRIDALRKRLVDADKAAAGLQKTLAEALSFRDVEKGSRDSAQIINDDFDILIEMARKRAVAEGKVGKELEKQVALLEKQRQKALETARERNKKPSANTSLPKVTSAEVQSLIKEVFGSGTAITSTTRSAQRNKAVGGGANSYHLNGTAVDFVPQGGMKAFDKEMLRLAAEARGIKVLELLGPGDKGHNDHGHLAFSRTRQGADQIASAREREAAKVERAAAAEEARQSRQESILGSLQERYFAALAKLAEGTEESAEARKTAIETERVNLAAKLDGDKKLDQAARDEAKRLNDATADLAKQIIDRAEAEKQFKTQEQDRQRALTVAEALNQQQQDLLRSQGDVADTQRERADIALRLVGLQYAEERMMLKEAIDREARLKAEYDRTKSEQVLAELKQAEVDAAIARAQMGTIDEREANTRTATNRANQSPLDSYFGDIQAQANDLNTAFEAIAAGGLQNFEDKLTDAIVNFRSLGDVGRAVLSGLTADLVRLAIRMVLNATVGKAISSTTTAATAAQAAAAATAWAPAAAAASLATLGANAAPAAAAIAATNALAFSMAAASGAGAAGAAFADGGHIRGPGGQRGDKIPIWASDNEFMVNARSVKKLGVGTLDYINRFGALPPMLANGGLVRGPSNVPARAPGGYSAGFGQRDREFLAGEIGRAISAMPPIQLFPTTRPEAALQQALRTPGGRRAMFDFFSSEPRAIGGALGK